MTLRKPKIALFLPSLCGGGAERVMALLANGFAERGYAVDLVLVKAGGPYMKDLSANVQVVDLKADRVLTCLPSLVCYLRRHRPATLLAAMGHANVISILACRFARVPTRVVVSEHNNFSVSRANAKFLRARLMGSFMARAYPCASGVVAVSAGVADDLARSIGLPRSSINVVYNPVVTRELLAQSHEELMHPWLQPGEKPVILGVGRLSEQKGFITLLHAFARLRQERAVRLLILGEGELRQQLTARVAELGLQSDVDLHGFSDNPFPFMRHSALFVLSSAWEGFGNVLVEAMACGTPVVSTDCPSGPAEILEGGLWGRLVPVGDVKALAKAMASALDEPDPPGVAARAAEFSVDRAVDCYLKILFQESLSR